MSNNVTASGAGVRLDLKNASTTDRVEAERAASLKYAQDAAEALFAEIEATIIRPGISEKQMVEEIDALAKERHNLTNKWHKHTVRSGANTLFPYKESRPDRVVQEDDILFIDLGPVFEAWEADFGRTFVLGSDKHKIAIRDALEPIWKIGKAAFEKDDKITGEELFTIIQYEAESAGYELGGLHVGHNLGDFPHERIPKDKITLYITEGNHQKMKEVKDKKGMKRHWVLEVHLVDRDRQIGGFFEQLLMVD